ncbi:MAG: hypothetical protein CVT66_05195 [Actinobacteria bacterium HGW-Actinobacteria-6]|jgi:hypothetical protein|nr:MAG: hypothetical protein CVT66_05195 [Actinobacteria bacterium HGW-Actinobacteria-6]
MRKIAAVLVVAMLAFVLAGCGGGTDETATTETPAVDAPAPAVAVPVAVTDRSQIESGFPAQFPAIESTTMPTALQSKLDAKRPLLIYFYDSTLPESAIVRTEIDVVLSDNRGLIDLVTFDLGAKKAGAYTEGALLGAVLASELNADRPPYIILVDSKQNITWRFRGYVDRDVIDREVLRATE